MGRGSEDPENYTRLYTSKKTTTTTKKKKTTKQTTTTNKKKKKKKKRQQKTNIRDIIGKNGIRTGLARISRFFHMCLYELRMRIKGRKLEHIFILF